MCLPTGGDFVKSDRPGRGFRAQKSPTSPGGRASKGNEDHCLLGSLASATAGRLGLPVTFPTARSLGFLTPAAATAITMGMGGTRSEGHDGTGREKHQEFFHIVFRNLFPLPDCQAREELQPFGNGKPKKKHYRNRVAVAEAFFVLRALGCRFSGWQSRGHASRRIPRRYLQGGQHPEIPTFR